MGNENNQVEGQAFQGLILPISEGFFWSLSIEEITYDKESKKKIRTAKGKLAGKADSYTQAKIKFSGAKWFIEQELAK